METQKGKVFISYRREGGINIARTVLAELEKRGYDVFLDLEGLGAGKFNEALLHEIETSSNFVLILSPGSLDRCANQGDWVRTEIRHAMNKGINIVPIIIEPFDYPKNLPSEIKGIRNINAVKWSNEYFSACISKLESFFVEKQPQEDLYKVQPEPISNPQKEENRNIENQTDTSKSNKKEKSKIGPIAVGIAGAIVLLGLLGIFLFLNRDKAIADTSVIEAYGNSSGNLCNGGSASIIGTTANGHQTLCYLNKVDSKWQYWYDKKKGAVKKKETDNESVVLFEQERLSYLLATPEWLYYTVGEGMGTLYRAPRNRDDGNIGDVEEVLTGIAMENNLIIDNNVVYYCKEGKGLFSYSITKQKEKTILVDETTWDFSLVGKHDKWLYLMDNTHVWRVNVSNSKEEDVVQYSDLRQDSIITAANVYGSWIYITVKDSGTNDIQQVDEIYRIRLDGTQQSRIFMAESINHTLDRVNVCGDQYLYMDVISGTEVCSYKVIEETGVVKQVYPEEFEGFTTKIEFDEGNTQDNLCNFGFIGRGIGNEQRVLQNQFCEELDYFYSPASKNVLLQHKVDDKYAVEVLLRDVDCSYLYVVPEWIVYVIKEEGVWNLYRAENEFQNFAMGEPKLLESDILAENNVIVNDGLIYYWKANEGLYSMKINTEERNLCFGMQEGVSYRGWEMYNIENDIVYYSNGYNLLWISLEDKRHVFHMDGEEHFPGGMIVSAISKGDDTYMAVHYKDGIKPDEIWKKEGKEAPQLYVVLDAVDQQILHLNLSDYRVYAWIEENDEIKIGGFEFRGTPEWKFY